MVMLGFEILLFQSVDKCLIERRDGRDGKWGRRPKRRRGVFVFSSSSPFSS